MCVAVGRREGMMRTQKTVEGWPLSTSVRALAAFRGRQAVRCRTAMLVPKELPQSLSVLAAFQRCPRTSSQAEKPALATCSGTSVMVFSITSVLSDFPSSVLVEA